MPDLQTSTTATWWQSRPETSKRSRQRRRREQSAAAQLPEIAARLAWRYRWQLAPVVGAGLALWLGGALALLGAALVGAGAWWWARDGRGIRGRMVLSVRERRTVMWWAAGVAVWAVGALLPVPWAGHPLVLAAATGWQAVRWGRSRPVRRPVQSAAGQAVADRWVRDAATGHGPLSGSTVVVPTVREPADGAVTFSVRLRPGQHADDAVGDSVRRHIESTLGMPPGAVRVRGDEQDARIIVVTLSPVRHMESEPVPWPGPQLGGPDGGDIPIARTADGQTIDVMVWGRQHGGVTHGLIVGTSGSGKSGSTWARVLPLVVAGQGVLWCVDGKGGGSSPRLRPAIDWLACRPAEWGSMIEAAHRVLVSRRERRTDRGEWIVPEEPDPVLTLLIDECAAVTRSVSPAHHGMVLEMLEQGRSLGISVILVSQDPAWDKLPGGRAARDLAASAGSAILHRVGGRRATFMASDSASEQVDLTSLPAAPGSAAIIQFGQVLARSCRVAFVSGDALTSALSGVEIRSLVGADAAAAGRGYTGRLGSESAAEAGGGDGRDLDEELRELVEADGQASSPEEQRADDAARLVRDVVLQVLQNANRPLRRSEIARQAKTSPSATSLALRQLADAGKVSESQGQRWVIAPCE